MTHHRLRWRPRTFRYLTCCVAMGMAKVDDLNAMIAAGRPVTYMTFTQHVAREDLVRVFDHYEWGYRTDGLRMKNDYHVAYFRSIYQGQRCYYLVHSAIEYIFTEPGGQPSADDQAPDGAGDRDEDEDDWTMSEEMEIEASILRGEGMERTMIEEGYQP